MKKFKVITILSLLTVFFVLSNNVNAQINVATAANMKGTANLLVKEFNKTHKDISVNIVSASSGELFQQISHGAPFQIFISADTDFPNKLAESNLTINKPDIYAYGQLVIAMPNNKIKINNVKDILNKDIVHIAVANPKLAPYGKAAMDLLNNQKLYNKVQNKVVIGNSLNDVNQYVFSKSVDIAFTNKSALVLNNSIKYYEIPAKLYNPIAQSMVLVKTDDENAKKEAVLFYQFIKSDAGKKILVASGYTTL